MEGLKFGEIQIFLISVTTCRGKSSRRREMFQELELSFIRLFTKLKLGMGRERWGRGTGLKLGREGIHGSSQILIGESMEIVKHAPLSTRLLVELISFQIQEEVVGLESVDIKGMLARYLAERILTHSLSLEEAKSQASLEIKALLESKVLLKPRPPTDLGRQIESQHLGMKEFPF